MDPNVQVALISVFATTITTLGVVMVAVINNRKERTKAASAGVEAGLDEGEVLEKLLNLMDENRRKEATIVSLRARAKKAETENADLRAQLKSKGEVS